MRIFKHFLIVLGSIMLNSLSNFAEGFQQYEECNKEEKNLYEKQFNKVFESNNTASTIESVKTKIKKILSDTTKIETHLLFYLYIYKEGRIFIGFRLNLENEKNLETVTQKAVDTINKKFNTQFTFELNTSITKEIVILLNFMNTTPNDILLPYKNTYQILKQITPIYEHTVLCDPFNVNGEFLIPSSKNLYAYCANQEQLFITKLTLYINYKIENAHVPILNPLKDDMELLGYDVIITKMPNEQNIKHADTCERVNKLKIRGTKCEPLYLQLLMTSLNNGGHCVVIVPKTLLVNESQCHIQTRKYLLENFEVKNIMQMDQFYSLHFINSGKPTIMYTINSCKQYG